MDSIIPTEMLRQAGHVVEAGAQILACERGIRMIIARMAAGSYEYGYGVQPPMFTCPAVGT